MKRITMLTVLMALAGMLAAPSRATETDMIFLGDRVVMRIRAGAQGYSPVDRADAIRGRLTSILAAVRVQPSDVTIRQEEPGQDAAIYVQDHLLVRVDRSLTAANRMEDPLELARIWASNLQKALPQVTSREKLSRAGG